MTRAGAEEAYRPLRAADIPVLAHLLPDLLPGDWSAQTLLALLQSAHLCRVYTDENNGNVIGFAECTVVADECELLAVAIAPRRQGRGLGKRLLAGVLAEARGRGCRHCYLEVRRSNDPAIALYTGAGFTLTGVRKGYYAPGQRGEAAEDALLYSLSLASGD